MITINDMIEQTTIQGKVIVKNWKGNDMVVAWVGTDEPNSIPKALRDTEILFMYPQDNGIVIEVNTSYDAKRDAWKNYLDYELEDDDTPDGGIAYMGETLREFLFEVSDSFCEDDEIAEQIYETEDITLLNVTNEEVNKALKECGIKPINFEV